MRRSWVPALGALAACASGPARVAYAPSPAPAAASRAAAAHDLALAPLGVPPLATHAVPDDVRELRLSRGGSWVLGHADVVLRIVQRGRAVAGEVIWYRADVAGLAPGEPVRRWRAAVAPRSRAVRWDRLLARLDALGVDTLAPARDTFAVMDAGHLVVEVRRHAAYRAYDLDAPAMHDGESARRMAQIMDVIDSVARLAPPP